MRVLRPGTSHTSITSEEADDLAMAGPGSSSKDLDLSLRQRTQPPTSSTKRAREPICYFTDCWFARQKRLGKHP